MTGKKGQRRSSALRLRSAAVLLGGAALALFAAGSAVAQAPAPATEAYSPDIDPMWSQPYVDVDEWRDAPVRHRYVHGGFKGTETRFSFYFPAKEQYQGRFFQYITPVPDSETSSQAQTGSDNPTAFSIASGAYFVETNGGGSGALAGPGHRGDPLIGAYKANAAAAEYSRTLAQQMYGGKRPFGYIYGGSGGAYRTIGSIENTRVWEGAVPFVMGSPMAIPNVFAVRMHAMRVLWDKFPQIVDAMDAGGNGDPYAGLNEVEASALREATRLGFPPESWFGWKTMGVHAFTTLYPGVVSADPSYFTDFWTKPGYLGHDHPEQLAKDRVQFPTSVKALLSAEQAEARGIEGVRIAGTARGSADLAWQSTVNDGTARPIAVQLAGTPPTLRFFGGGDLVIQSGAAKGKRLGIQAIHGDVAMLGVVDVRVLAQLKPGDEVVLDNSNFLAAQTYYRHQVPGPEYKVWDQFRGPDGKPIYPQRPMLIGPSFARSAAGTVPTGKFAGKMVVVESLWDREAFPWQADWYRDRVKEHLGARTDANFRLWMTDRALHGGVEDPTRVVNYVPMLQQALRDVAAWVEKGTPPPASTNYKVIDSQVVVPPTAAARKGIQPVVRLRANGKERAEVKVGQPVTLTGTIEVPPGTGYVVGADWDLDGSGTFAQKSAVPARATRANVTITHRFDRAGTYFPVLRGASNRQGDAASQLAPITNLDRVRVVVK